MDKNEREEKKQDDLFVNKMCIDMCMIAYDEKLFLKTVIST